MGGFRVRLIDPDGNVHEDVRVDTIGEARVTAARFAREHRDKRMAELYIEDQEAAQAYAKRQGEEPTE
jgi:hypothetical protein